MMNLKRFRRFVAVIASAVIVISTNACETPDSVRKQVFKRDSAAAISKPGKAKVSKPYKINGVKYYPIASAKGFKQKGVASWYGPDFHGKLTANGETYNQMEMTAAHKTLPFNTVLKVSNLENGKSITVRINDRGPFVGKRIIDLSKKGAMEIGMMRKGTALVKLKVASASERRFHPSPRRYVEKGRKDEAPAAPTSAAAKLESGTLPSVYYVQAGSFSNRLKAEDFKSSLEGKYGKVSIKKKIFFSGKVHRVVFGPYAGREAAEKAARSINRSRAVKGAFVIANP